MTEEQPKTTPTEQPTAVARTLPELRAGYTVRLTIKIKEGKKERLQNFEGMIIKMSGATPITKTITVRKAVKGFGVEKIIPLAMPALTDIKVLKKAAVRKAKLYNLRRHTNKKLKETIVA
ncbi:MAG: 50S ribosomal protein L19 [Patescibacteria group bacterium]|jgi:large subunit ribosomal protein L19